MGLYSTHTFVVVYALGCPVMLEYDRTVVWGEVIKVYCI